MATDTFAGPVNCTVFGFPDTAQISPGLRVLLDRVDKGLIEILDLECFQVSEEKEANVVPMSSFLQLDEDIRETFDGALSNILDSEDLALIAQTVEAGWFALAIVYEDRSLAQAAEAWASVGGKELLSGGVDIEQLEAILS